MISFFLITITSLRLHFFLPLVISAETGQLCLIASLGKRVLLCPHTENSVGFILKSHVLRELSFPDRSGSESQEECQEKGRLGLLDQEGEEHGKGTEGRRLLI